ncbi:MAG: hypothetical protein GXY32_01840 [Ruminococcaceae bacterium]|nr:hypothetical protein [Oscillospiraceae bacterium]
MKKNGFLTFICALVPGFGQMYQGYMRRGVSLAFWFCAVIAVAALARLEFLLILLPVVWAYSFFDSFNIRNLSPEQRAAFGDNTIPAGGWVRQGAAGRQRGIKVLGWVLIVVGALVLYNTFYDTFYWDVYQTFPQVAVWLSRIPALLIGAAVVVVGILALRGKRTPPPEDDIQDFKGGDKP